MRSRSYYNFWFCCSRWVELFVSHSLDLCAWKQHARKWMRKVNGMRKIRTISLSLSRFCFTRKHRMEHGDVLLLLLLMNKLPFRVDRAMSMNFSFDSNEYKQFQWMFGVFFCSLPSLYMQNEMDWCKIHINNVSVTIFIINYSVLSMNRCCRSCCYSEGEIRAVALEKTRAREIFYVPVSCRTLRFHLFISQKNVQIDQICLFCHTHTQIHTLSLSLSCPLNTLFLSNFFTHSFSSSKMFQFDQKLASYSRSLWICSQTLHHSHTSHALK